MFFVDTGIFIMRVVLGLILAGHGAQKLFGWFGGHGIEGTTGFFENLNLAPAKFWAYVVALAEFLGGLALALGVLTPVAGAVIIADMVVAILKVHAGQGFWNTDRGYEYPLLIMAVAGAIGLSGPGQYSLDQILNVAYPMPETFFIALAVAVLGALASIYSGQLRAADREQQREG